MRGQTGFLAQHAAARAQPGAGAGASDRLQGIQKQSEGNAAIDVNLGADDAAATAGRGHAHSHSKLGMLKRICSSSGGWLLSVVGLDLYTRGKAGEGLKRASGAANPFDQGLLSNCKDFWSKGQDLAIDYPTLYDLPAEISPGHCQVMPFLIDTVTRGGPSSVRGSKYSLLRSSADDEDDEEAAEEISGERDGGKRRWSMWSQLKSGSAGGAILPTTNGSHQA